MRVVCINIPKSSGGAAQALYETKYGLSNAKYFLHQLDELAETLLAPFSLEFYSSANTVYCCMAGSDEVLDVLSTGIYSWLGDCQIIDVEDYTHALGRDSVAIGLDFCMERPDVSPLRNYETFKTDSLIPILMPMQNIPDGDRMLLQIVAKPMKGSFIEQLAIRKTQTKERLDRFFKLETWIKKGLPSNIPQHVKWKCSQRLFWVNYRVAAFCDLPAHSGAEAQKAAESRLKGHLKGFIAGMPAYGFSDQKLAKRPFESGAQLIQKMRQRRLIKPFRLSSTELTTLFHPPTLGTLPNTSQVLSRKAPAPPELPSARRDPSVGDFGCTNYRDHEIEFGISRPDRRRHLYVLGKSGSGKSCLLQLLVKDDIEKGFGCAVLDPHGDLVDDILRLIPKHRIDDVVLFDPSIRSASPSFNPMDPIRPELKLRVAMSFLDSFKRVFGADWSERMDHVLRYAVLGLLSAPGCNLVSLRRMLADERYRGEIVRQARDESVKRFWLREFVQRRKDFEEGPISQLLNRLDELLATETMRNILGQTTNLFNFRDFMDTQKIVLLKVSKGVLGSENATLLGSLLVWKIYEAAMSRADVPAEDRQDFYLYVDEFQNFATESFGEILSEARKYNLSLTFANQYLSQLPGSIRKTIFGNVANLLSFRIGAEDAGTVAAEFAPQFNDDDLINLAIRDFYLKMSINGYVQTPFSGHTLDLHYPAAGKDFAEQAIAASLRKYCVASGAGPKQRAG